MTVKEMRIRQLRQLHTQYVYHGAPARRILWCRKCVHVTTAGYEFSGTGFMRCWKECNVAEGGTFACVLKPATNPLYEAAMRLGGKEAVIALFEDDVPIDVEGV